MSGLFFYAHITFPRVLHVDASIGIRFLGNGNDTFYQSDERRNIGPAEYQIKNPHECLSGIEFMRPKATEEKCQKNIGEFAHSLLSWNVGSRLLLWSLGTVINVDVDITIPFVLFFLCPGFFFLGLVGSVQFGNAELVDEFLIVVSVYQLILHNYAAGRNLQHIVFIDGQGINICKIDDLCTFRGINLNSLVNNGNFLSSVCGKHKIPLLRSLMIIHRRAAGRGRV